MIGKTYITDSCCSSCLKRMLFKITHIDGDSAVGNIICENCGTISGCVIRLGYIKKKYNREGIE